VGTFLRHSVDVMLMEQVEINRRRDTEMQKMQRDLEDAQSQNEAQLSTFRKKHQEAVNQLTEQMDQLHKVKQKYVYIGYCSTGIINRRYMYTC